MRALSIVVFLLVTHLIYTLIFRPLRDVSDLSLAKYTQLWRTSRYFQGSWLDS